MRRLHDDVTPKILTGHSKEQLICLDRLNSPDTSHDTECFSMSTTPNPPSQESDSIDDVSEEDRNVAVDEEGEVQVDDSDDALEESRPLLKE
ncbi:unnamed protein product [Hydatigera taeniaeformis]|uniref:Uncharacterized protein n=1 Tax=Hydatigena taeniaeformis TaxID=6205 RepID=A0A0R3X8S9_HYDTA|nr:unnamed protein product [Hydatigera taeniaeformis]